MELDYLTGEILDAMIKWPGKIKPSKSNGMVSIHDFFSTLGNIIGADIPDDRAIDSIDQTDFFLGKQKNSNRQTLLSFLGDEMVAVRWKNYRMYPKNWTETTGNPSMGGAFGARLKPDDAHCFARGARGSPRI